MLPDIADVFITLPYSPSFDFTMRIPWIPLLFFLVISVFSDVYIYRSLCQRLRNRLLGSVQLWSSVFFYILFISAVSLPRREGDNSMLLSVMWMMYAFLSVYFAKYIFVAIDLLANIPRLFKKKRIRLVSMLATLLAVVAFVAMWWGALINRFNIDVKEVDIPTSDLPKGFDGYRIVQISDFHTGTYGNDTTFVAKVVDTINSLDADLVVFTGDIVNSRSSELAPHVKPLSRLKAKDGVFSIMGNHDYGDYADWPSKAAKDSSIQYLKDLQSSMGWRMLNNSSVKIFHGGDSIAVIGVENIGDHPFPIYGSLTKAYPTPEDSVFKVLLSHNPAHWNDSISGNSRINIPLTLSGHTHAMQMEIAGVSPAVWRYSTWGGLYADADSVHRMYVNIGVGTVGFPSRIGANPEITVLKLIKK